MASRIESIHLAVVQIRGPELEPPARPPWSAVIVLSFNAETSGYCWADRAGSPLRPVVNRRWPGHDDRRAWTHTALLLNPDSSAAAWGSAARERRDEGGFTYREGLDAAVPFLSILHRLAAGEVQAAGHAVDQIRLRTDPHRRTGKGARKRPRDQSR